MTVIILIVQFYKKWQLSRQNTLLDYNLKEYTNLKNKKS